MNPFHGGGPPAPLGFALFLKEINVPPHGWVERNVCKAMIHWTAMPRGGHFAALELADCSCKTCELFGKVPTKAAPSSRWGAAPPQGPYPIFRS